MKGILKVETPKGVMIFNVPIHLFLLDKWHAEGGRIREFLDMVKDEELKVYIDDILIEPPASMKRKD